MGFIKFYPTWRLGIEALSDSGDRSADSSSTRLEPGGGLFQKYETG